MRARGAALWIGAVWLLAAPLAHAGNCEGLASPRDYRCFLEAEEQGAFDFCANTFPNEAGFGFFFGGAEFLCLCKATGTVDEPSFESDAHAFHCVVNESDGETQQGDGSFFAGFNGKASLKNGHTLLRGDGVIGDGEGFVYRCHEDPHCAGRR